MDQPYTLFRKIITPEDRELNIHLRPEDTHIINIDMLINKDVWQATPVSIDPSQLKAAVGILKNRILFSANEKYGDLIVPKSWLA